MKRGRGRPPKQKNASEMNPVPNRTAIANEMGKHTKSNVAKKKRVDGKSGNKLQKSIDEVKIVLQATSANVEVLKETFSSEINSMKEKISSSSRGTQIFIMSSDSSCEISRGLDSTTSVHTKYIKNESNDSEDKTKIQIFDYGTNNKPRVFKKFRPPISQYKIKEQEKAASIATITNETCVKSVSLVSSEAVVEVGTSSSELQCPNAWLERKGSLLIKNCFSLQKMLSRESLICTYKCLDTDCSFATLSHRNFERHLKVHEEIRVTEFLYSCPYCLYKGDLVSDLLVHYANHNHDKYQCAYCFYRSASDSSCWEHVNTHHNGKPLRVFECPLESPVSSDVTYMKRNSSRNKNVQPLNCSSKKQIDIIIAIILFHFKIFTDCNQKFFLIDRYEEHLNQHAEYSETRKLALADWEVYKNNQFNNEVGLFECLFCVYATGLRRKC